MSTINYTEKEKQYIRRAYIKANKQVMSSELFEKLSDKELNKLLSVGKGMAKSANLKATIGYVVAALILIGIFLPSFLKNSSRNTARNAVIKQIQHPDACSLVSGLVAYGPDNPLALPPGIKVSVFSDKTQNTNSTCQLVLDYGTDKYFSLITVNYDYSTQKNQSASDAQKITSDSNSYEYYYRVSFSEGFYDGTVLTAPLSGTPTSSNDLSSSFASIIAANAYCALPDNSGITPAK